MTRTESIDKTIAVIGRQTRVHHEDWTNRMVHLEDWANQMAQFEDWANQIALLVSGFSYRGMHV